MRRMKMIKKKIIMFLFATIIIFSISFGIEKGYEVKRSTVVSSENLTEVWLHVVLNQWNPVDWEKMAKEIVNRQPPVGDGSKQVFFKIELYRTDFHYRHGWKCDTVLCDENGNIVDKFRT